MKHSLIISGIAVLLTLVLTMLGPWSLHSLTTRNCQPDPIQPEISVCDPVANGWSVVSLAAMAVGMFVVPFALGAFGGMQYTRRKEQRFVTTVRNTAVSIAAYLMVMAIIEVIVLQPWNSTPYNRYTLDAVYGSGLVVAFFLLCLFGFLAPLLFSPCLWSRLRPLGFLNRNPTKVI